jgi:hypothetical protein
MQIFGLTQDGTDGAQRWKQHATPRGSGSLRG